MTHKEYLENQEKVTADATITAITNAVDGRRALRLDRTIFHPQGGGQKADCGTIDGVKVEHVVHTGDEVDHILTKADFFTVGQRVTLGVDSNTRSINSKYHSAGHLLGGLVEQLYPGLHAVSGHQWPGEARVEFAGEVGRSFEVELIARAVAQAILADWPVTLVGNPFAHRAVRIGSLSAIPCGGTHVRNLSALTAIQITGAKSKGGRLRVSYALVEEGQ